MIKLSLASNSANGLLFLANYLKLWLIERLEFKVTCSTYQLVILFSSNLIYDIKNIPIEDDHN